MQEIEIQNAHGYMLDSDEKVCLKFGDWEVGTHTVPQHVESIRYVDGPSTHGVEVHEDYRVDQP